MPNTVALKPNVARVDRLRANVETVIRGKSDVISHATVALLARGHVLLEDVPGVGKTTLARSIARSIHGSFRRIQFTSDLLPSDIVGVSIFDPERREADLNEIQARIDRYWDAVG